MIGCMNFTRTFIFVIFVSLAALAQHYPNKAAEKFIFYESMNDYVPDTTVNQAFRPQFQRFFKIKFIEIPHDQLNVTEALGSGASTHDQFIFNDHGQKMVRFFIHPDSEHLYGKLMQKYGVKGEYWAAPTSSTRSVLAWNTNEKEPAIFLKLSLAQNQDGMGRIIPDWEVRRSVGISQLIASTPKNVWKSHGAVIIPEFAGATIKKEADLPFYIDQNQGEVYEHGLIARDASFLNTESQNEFRPLFSFFTEINGQPPLIISLWKKSRYVNFYDYVDNVFFKNFIEKNSYLFFNQGIVPEIHGQNVVVEYDPTAEEIVSYLHRDVGSMKVDLRLRWINGLDISMLRTPNAAFDFKFTRATEVYESVFTDYLNDWLFKWGYLKTIQKYVPTFDPEKTKSRLQKRLLTHIKKILPIKSKYDHRTVKGHMEAYYSENPIFNSKPVAGSFSDIKIKEFISSQLVKKQFMKLPPSWIENLKINQAGYLVTEYGIIFKPKADEAFLIYHSSSDLKEIKTTVPAPQIMKRNSKKRIGFYSGTFDPPHQGHLLLLQNAIKDLQLDILYVIPNVDPSHKPGASSNEDRMRMTKLAFQDLPEVVVGDTEHMKRVTEDGVGGYQHFLSEKFSEGLVYQIMGDDSLEKALENPEISFPKNFVIAVAARDSQHEILVAKAKGTPVVKLPTDSSGFSSTLFRNKIRAGQSPTELKSTVKEYIKAKGLYQNLILQCKYLF